MPVRRQRPTRAWGSRSPPRSSSPPCLFNAEMRRHGFGEDRFGPSGRHLQVLEMQTYLLPRRLWVCPSPLPQETQKVNPGESHIPAYTHDGKPKGDHSTCRTTAPEALKRKRKRCSPSLGQREKILHQVSSGSRIQGIRFHRKVQGKGKKTGIVQCSRLKIGLFARPLAGTGPGRWRRFQEGPISGDRNVPAMLPPSSPVQRCFCRNANLTRSARSFAHVGQYRWCSFTSG